MATGGKGNLPEDEERRLAELLQNLDINDSSGNTVSHENQPSVQFQNQGSHTLIKYDNEPRRRQQQGQVLYHVEDEQNSQQTGQPVMRAITKQPCPMQDQSVFNNLESATGNPNKFDTESHEDNAVWIPPQAEKTCKFKLIVKDVEEVFTIKAMVECEKDGEIEEHLIVRKPEVLEPHMMQYIIDRDRDELQKITGNNKFKIVKSAKVSCLKVKAKNVDMETAKQNLDSLIQDLGCHKKSLVCYPLDIPTKLQDLFWKEIENSQLEGRISQDVAIFRRSKTYFYVGKQSELLKDPEVLKRILRQLKHGKDNAGAKSGLGSQDQVSASFDLTERQSEIFDKTNCIHMAKNTFRSLAVSKEGMKLNVSGNKEKINEFNVWFDTFINSLPHEARGIPQEMHCLLTCPSVVKYVNEALGGSMIHAHWEVLQSSQHDSEEYVLQVTAFTSDTIRRAFEAILSCIVSCDFPKKLLQDNRFKAVLDEYRGKVTFRKGNGEMETLFCTKDVERSLKKKEEEIKSSIPPRDVHEVSESAELDVPAAVVVLIKHGAVKEFVDEILKRKHISASWDVVLTEEESRITSKASSKLIALQCCKEIRDCFIHTSYKKSLSNHREVSKLMEGNKGKILISGRKNEDSVFCVVVYSRDIKSLVEKVFQEVEKQEQLRMNEEENAKEEIDVKLTEELHQFLLMHCREQLDQIEKDLEVTIKHSERNYTINVKGFYDKVKTAEGQILKIIKGIQVSSEVVRTRKSLESEEIRDFVSKEEKSETCLIAFEEEREDRLNYQYSWIVSDKSAHAVYVILAKGDAETAHCDALVCPVRHDWMPVNKIATTIFQKGDARFIKAGVEEFLHSDAGKKIKSRCIEGDVIPIHSQGHLDAEFIMLSVFPSWQKVEYIDNKAISLFISSLVANAAEKKWRKIVVPVEFNSPEISANFCTLLVKFLDRYRKDLNGALECIFVLSERDYSVKIWRSLEDHFGDLDPNKVFRVNFQCAIPDLNQPKKLDFLQSPIKLDVRKDSMISVSNQVDMIVNSTNRELNLTLGFISKEILKYGGEQLNIELKQRYPQGIIYGEIAITSGGQLKCSFICHGVCFPSWLEDGKYSLKVMHTFVWNCLVQADKRKCRSVALPALGTGRLEYPTLQVAKQMIRTVKEYGSRHPNTIIEKVVFVVHDEEAFKDFLNVRESTEKKKTLRQTIELPENLEYLEAVDQSKKVRVQIHTVSTAIHSREEIEARITCSRSKSTCNATIFPVLQWNESSCCYDGKFEIGKLDKTAKEKAVEYVFNLCNECRLLAVAIYIEDDVLHYKELAEWFQKYECQIELPQGTSKASTTVQKKKKRRYLNLMQIILRPDDFKICEGLYKKPSYVQMVKNAWDSFKFLPIEKSQTTVLRCQVYAKSHKTTQDVLKKLNVLLTSEAFDVTNVSGSWAVKIDGRFVVLPDYCQKDLNNAVGLRNQYVEILHLDDGLTYKYDIDNMTRILKQGTAYKEEELRIIDERETDEDSLQSYDVISLKELEDKSLEMSEGSAKGSLAKKEFEKENVKVFETVTANLTAGGDVDIKEVGSLLHASGINVSIEYDTSKNACLKGELSEIQKAQELLKENLQMDNKSKQKDRNEKFQRKKRLGNSNGNC